MKNPYTQSFRHLRDIFTTTVWSYVGAQGVTNYYRPMMTFGYLVCYRLFGPLAYGFHLANVLLHVAVVCLLFLVTEHLFRRRDLAFAAAALFAIHPAHSESVAWIAAVTDLELTLFYLLTFWFFLRLAEPVDRISGWIPLATVLSFAGACLSKEQAMTLPALATVYEHFYRHDRARTSWSEKLSRYGILWLVAVAYLLFRVRFFGALAPVTQISGMTWYETSLSASALIGQYLGKLIWPAHLCAFYVFHKSAHFSDPRVLGGFVALAATGALFVVLWKRERVASFGVLWLLATLAPVLNPRWMAANVFAERYLYLPSVGFAWLFGWACVGLASALATRSVFRRRAFAVSLAALAVLCMFRIYTRDQVWQNDIVLYTRTLADQPDAYHIHNNLGTVYWLQGNTAAAGSEWRVAVKLAPHNTVILNNLGLFCSKAKHYTEAVDFFRRAMQLKPKYTDPHLNLGTTYQEMGLRSEAELQLRAAVALSPLDTRARNELGKLDFDCGRLAEAEEQFRRSVESEPNTTAYDALGDIYTRWGDRGRAEAGFQSALALSPFDSHAHFGLGALYLGAGQDTKALSEYESGIQTDPANSDALLALQQLKARASQPPLGRRKD